MRKAVIALVALAVLGWLFWRTVQSSLAEPYVVDAGMVAEWTLACVGRCSRAPAARAAAVGPASGRAVPADLQSHHGVDDLADRGGDAARAARRVPRRARERAGAAGRAAGRRGGGRVGRRAGAGVHRRRPARGLGHHPAALLRDLRRARDRRFRQALARRYAEAGGTAAFEPTGFRSWCPSPPPTRTSRVGGRWTSAPSPTAWLRWSPGSGGSPGHVRNARRTSVTTPR